MNYSAVIVAASIPVVLGGAPRPSAGQAPDAHAKLAVVLEKARAYAKQFEQEFSHVVGVEVYTQYSRAPRRPGQRRIESEVYFARLDDASPWVTVRDVLKVDGRQMSTTRAAIENAFADRSADRLARLKALADEGARFNLGNISRNFSDPTLAVLFVGDRYRPRFNFSPDGTDTLQGRPVVRIKYVEIARPTVITGLDGVDLPASGLLFIDDRGRVLKSQLVVGSPAYSSTLTVTFRQDGVLQMLVPALMEERHLAVVNGRQLIIVCRAEYSRFRRFETSGRIISPDR